MTDYTHNNQECRETIDDLRARLAEAEETLRAIRSGEVDALVIAGPRGNQVYTLKGAESTYRILVEAMNEGALVLTNDGTVMYSNKTFAGIVGKPLEQVIGSRIHRFVQSSDRKIIDGLLEAGINSITRQEIIFENESEERLVPALLSVGRLQVDEIDGISAVVTDLTEHKNTEAELQKYREHLEDLVVDRTTELEVANNELRREIEERKRIEKALRESEIKYSALFNNKTNGIAHCRVITDENGKPVDYIVLEINDAYEEITGIKRKDVEGKRATDIFPGLEHFDYDYIANYGKVALEGIELSIEVFFEPLKQWLSIYVFSPKYGEFIVMFTDITERIYADEELVKAKELAEHQTYLLQRALIPSKPPLVDGYSIASAYIPAYAGTEIGGDFLDVFETESGMLGIQIGDVAGKGIESAALAAATRSTIRAFAYDSSAAGDALTHANSVLFAQQSNEMQFVTSFLVVLDPVTGHIRYSSAGHPPAIICHKNGETQLLNASNMPLGIISNIVYNEADYTLMPGDIMILYTDGVTEARYDHNLFGTEGVENIVSKYSLSSSDMIVDGVLSAVKEWAHGILKDDTAILVIRREI